MLKNYMFIFINIIYYKILHFGHQNLSFAVTYANFIIKTLWSLLETISIFCQYLF